MSPSVPIEWAPVSEARDVDWKFVNKTDYRTPWSELAIPPSGIFDLIGDAADIVRTSAQVVKVFIDIIKTVINVLRSLMYVAGSGLDFIQEILNQIANALTDIFTGQGFHLFASKPHLCAADGDFSGLVDQLENSIMDDFDPHRPLYSDDAAIAGFYMVSTSKIGMAFGLPPLNLPELPGLPEWSWDAQPVAAVQPQTVLTARALVKTTSVLGGASAGGAGGDGLAPMVELTWDRYPMPKYTPGLQIIAPFYAPTKIKIYRNTQPFTENNPATYSNKILDTLDYDFGEDLFPPTIYIDDTVEAETDYWYAVAFEFDMYESIDQWHADESPQFSTSGFPLEFSNVEYIHTILQTAKVGPAPPPNWNGIKGPIYMFPELLKLVNFLKSFITSFSDASELSPSNLLDTIYNWLNKTSQYFGDLSSQIGEYLDAIERMFSPLIGVYSFAIASKSGGSKALVENFRYMVSDGDHMTTGIDQDDIPDQMNIGTHENIELDAALQRIEKRSTSEGLSPLQFGKAPRPVRGDMVHMVCMAAGSENPDTFSSLYDFIQLLIMWFGGSDEVPESISTLVQQAETAAGFVRSINMDLESQLGAPQPVKVSKPYKLGDNLEPGSNAAQCPATKGP